MVVAVEHSNFVILASRSVNNLEKITVVDSEIFYFNDFYDRYPVTT